MYQQISERLNTGLPFVNHVGIRVTDVGDGTAVAVMPEQPALHNHLRMPHAGAIFTLAETASGGAMAGALGPLMMSSRPLAADAQIKYLAKAAGNLSAHGKVVGEPKALREELGRVGKVSFPVQVDILDGEARKVAEFVATWHISQNASRTS